MSDRSSAFELDSARSRSQPRGSAAMGCGHHHESALAGFVDLPLNELPRLEVLGATTVHVPRVSHRAESKRTACGLDHRSPAHCGRARRPPGVSQLDRARLFEAGRLPGFKLGRRSSVPGVRGTRLARVAPGRADAEAGRGRERTVSAEAVHRPSRAPAFFPSPRLGAPMGCMAWPLRSSQSRQGSASILKPGRWESSFSDQRGQIGCPARRPCGGPVLSRRFRRKLCGPESHDRARDVSDIWALSGH
jgi:hypothetical protein